MVQWIEPGEAGVTDERAAALGVDHTTWDRPQFLIHGQLTTADRMPTAVLAPPSTTLALPSESPLDVDALELTDPLTGRTLSGSQFIDRRLHVDGLLVFEAGGVRYETYRNAMTASDRHVLHSVTKTLTTMMVGIAVEEGRLHVDEEVRAYVPALRSIDAWSGITLQHLLDMATGLDTEEHYEDPDSMYWSYAEAVGYYGHEGRPGPEGSAGAIDFVRRHLTETACPPGIRFNYASYLTNLLPACLESAYGRPAVELYEEHIHQRVGAAAPALLNCDRQRAPIVEGQLNLSLRDFARWALLMLDDGRNLAGEQVVPSSWVAETLTSSPARRAAFAAGDYAEVFPGAEYHNQAWLLDPEKQRMAMLGIHGQFAYLDVPRGLLIAGVASYPTQVDALMVASLGELWQGITAAVTPGSGGSGG